MRRFEMFAIKRNQVMITALLVMVVVAGYLNFAEMKNGQSNGTASVYGDEGDMYSALVQDGEIVVFADDEDMDVYSENGYDMITAQAEEDDTGAAVFVSLEADESVFFVQAKLEREQARAKQQDMLTEMMNNDNLTAEEISKCSDNMLTIQQRIEKETAAEAMIKAKGFGNAYVRIDDETVDVVVDKKELTDADIAQIEDIVKRKTSMSSDKIRISTLKSVQ
ncbi:MAG: SpoIIIAH-like family protein [Lachnospiraceae bacterium]|nr:SpoIIIAH-like family protein [Lachnospiraceae bacterium]